MSEPMLIAQSEIPLYLLPAMSNRHGLIAGATGTGKTVTLQVMAEAFSRIGVPVFAADVKGDLSGISQPGGEIFKIADDQGLLLLDLKDLQAMLQYAATHAKELQTQYGNISAASVGAMQRGLLALEQQGGDKFLGEPALNLDDLIQTDAQGHGVVNILAADKLINSPKLYATFLLWLLSELFEKLPEVGDAEKPKLVFFFDEAHLLFSDLPKVIEDKVHQVVRLVRSKGVGVFFVTQSPIDVPDGILGQLGNRVQHAVRAFTPKDQKAVKAAAQTFRANPEINVEQAILELGVGEGLVSFLDEKGTPAMVERALVCPPRSQIGPITPEQRQQIMRGSLVAGVYEAAVDRESAYELLKARAAQGGAAAGSQPVSAQQPALKATTW